jgi:predicted transport protein
MAAVDLGQAAPDMDSRFIGAYLELAESKSVSYHGPAFFLETLPRKHGLTLLLPLDFSEIDDPTGIAQDATQWKFFFYANYEGGVSLSISQDDDVGSAMPIIRQAHAAACT